MAKVLFVCSSLNYGGAQKVLSYVSCHLPKDWDITILLNSDDDIQFPYQGQILSLGVADRGDRQSLYYQGKVFWRRLRILSHLKKTGHFDSVVSFMDSGNVANILTGNRHCQVCITAVIKLSAETGWKMRKLVFPMVRLLYHRADKVMAETASIAEDLVKNFRVRKEQIVVVPNAIDTRQIKKQTAEPLPAAEAALFPAGRSIITAGRMEVQKGQWHLIRAFSQVHHRFPDAKLHIFGQGSLESYLKELVREYQLQDAIHFWGFSADLNRYIAQSAILAFPSLYEGMPTVVLEAFACGVPVVMTDFESGAREVLGKGVIPDASLEENVETSYGVICPVCSGEQLSAREELQKEERLLADAMETLLADEDYRGRCAAAGQAHAAQYDIGSVIELWMNALQSVSECS